MLQRAGRRRVLLWVATGVLPVRQAWALESLKGPNAQDAAYPTHAVRVVCPATAGGSIDTGARLIAAQMAAQLGQNVVVDNRPGAGTTLGTRLVAEAAADGYTLLVTALPVFSIGAELYPGAHYDPQSSFTPLGGLGRSTPFLVVAAGAHWHTVAEFVAAARARPGRLTVAHFGLGGASHVPAERLRRAAGLEFSFLPYKSEADSYADLAAGRVDASFYYGPMAVPQVRAGRLRALAHADTARHPALPEVPTLAEAGWPGAECHIDWLLLGPAGLPAAVASRLRLALTAAAAEPATSAALAAAGIDARAASAEAVARQIASQRVSQRLLLGELGLLRP